jgi:PGF-CTERM protein
VVNITETVEMAVDVTVSWTDGVNTLTGAISITVAGGTTFDPNVDGDAYTPGFTAALGVLSLLGAAVVMRRRRL